MSLRMRTSKISYLKAFCNKALWKTVKVKNNQASEIEYQNSDMKYEISRYDITRDDRRWQKIGVRVSTDVQKVWVLCDGRKCHEVEATIRA